MIEKNTSDMQTRALLQNYYNNMYFTPMRREKNMQLQTNKIKMGIKKQKLNKEKTRKNLKINN